MIGPVTDLSIKPYIEATLHAEILKINTRGSAIIALADVIGSRNLDRDIRDPEEVAANTLGLL